MSAGKTTVTLTVTSDCRCCEQSWKREVEVTVAYRYDTPRGGAWEDSGDEVLEVVSASGSDGEDYADDEDVYAAVLAEVRGE